jgi:lipopolysaccharide export system protein LptC
MERRTLILGGVLLAVLGGTRLLLETSSRGGIPTEQEPHNADYFLENFSNTVMNARGTPFRRLSADRMLHFPDDDSTELTKPHLTLFQNEHPLWQVQSEQGWLSGDGKLLLLNGPVTIDRAAAGQIRPLHIVTRNLRVQPEEGYAETDERIAVTSLGSRLESKGIQVWFKEPAHLKFLANVKGRYEID